MKPKAEREMKIINPGREKEREEEKACKRDLEVKERRKKGDIETLIKRNDNRSKITGKKQT